MRIKINKCLPAYSVLPIGQAVLCVILLSSCAQQFPPTGKPRDTKPPIAVKYSPDSAALNFKAKQVRILFNEFIQLKNINGQLIVSPPLKHSPDIKVKGKQLVISISDTLEPNTTYDFNFGGAVADYTEGNVLDNFQYIFSTGSFIDSLSLKGTVRDALTLNPQKDVLIMLYNTSDDSLPFKKLPNYFGKSKENGSFKINNIRAGVYKVFALKDVNSNYLYDSPEESIGFPDSVIDLKKNTSLEVLMFHEGPKKQFIKRSRILEFGHIQFIFNKPVIGLQIRPLNFNPSDDSWKTEDFNSGYDTLDLWIPDRVKDTVRLLLKDDVKMADTLEFVMPERNKKNQKLNLGFKTNAAGIFDLNKDVNIQFNHYLATSAIPRDSVRVMEDTLRDKKNDLDMLISKNRITLHKKGNGTWKENCKYKILISPGTISDIFGQKNDSVKIEFKTRELKNYGTLKMNIRSAGDLSGSLFQLLNSKDEVMVQHVINDLLPFTLEYLNPMEYKARIILDKNKNQKFDPGNYLKHLQPEKVIYYPDKITIRANWDLELDWKINSQ